MTMRITLLFEPSPDRTIPFAAGPERYQRLADELGRYAGVQVQFVKDVLRKAPTDSYVLFAGSGNLSRSLADCGPELAARLAPRIVLLDVSWQKALEQLEKHRLAGAVDSLRLSEWLARPSSCAGPFGLSYLTKVLGVSCVLMPVYRSARYCLLQSKRHRGMPHLLADYLVAYDRDQQPLSAVPLVPLTRVLPGGDEEAGGMSRTKSGREVESVSVKRAVESLKRARVRAGMTLAEVAERAALDLEPLALLEGSEYYRATLGTLRGYFRALEPTSEWTLAESGEPASREIPEPVEQSKTGKAEIRFKLVPCRTTGAAPAAIPASARLPAGTTWLTFEEGIPVLGRRRVRSWDAEGELDRPTTRAPKEVSHAGV
jgi:hypothetical protein